jgi:hypothetical protein
MSNDELKGIIIDLTGKSEKLSEAIEKSENDFKTVSMVCNNVSDLISKGVKGAREKEQESLQAAYQTLLANVKVIHETLLKEPQRLSIEVIKLKSKKQTLEETLYFLHMRARAAKEKEQKKLELADKILSGSLSEKRKPGQRPESIKSIRAAKAYIKENNLEQKPEEVEGNEDPVIEVIIDTEALGALETNGNPAVSEQENTDQVEE